MLKAKLYAIACARFLLWLLFSVLYVPAFVGYVALQVCEWFISFYEAFKAETNALLASFDEQLKQK